MTAERPLVTMAVMAWRQEHVVARAIRAAFAQTYRPLEIILSDDRSPDGTFRVMEEMAAAHDGPHKVILNRNPVNLGIVGHVNRIMEMASGRLFTSCAGDDIAEPHRIARLVEAWAAGGGRVKGVHSRVRKIDAEDRVIGEMAPRRWIIDDPGPDALTIATRRVNCIGATAMWDREVYDRFGPLSEDCLVEDGPLFFRAALLGEIAYVDEALVRYRVGGVSERRPRSPGHDYLFGDRMKYAAWSVGNARSFLHDLEKVGHPRAAEIRAACATHIERAGFELELSRRSAAGRVAAVPGAFWRSLASKTPFFARQSLKYAFAPLYIPYCNLRYRPPPAAN